MAISENWAELLEPGLRQIFEITRAPLVAQSVIPVLFDVQTSTENAEDHLGLGGFGDWNEYEGAIEYDENDQGYKTTLTHKEYVRGFKVERKLVDDDQYNIINARPRGLALAAQRTREKHAAEVFIYSFTATGYNGGDGVSLCDGSHPYSPENASTQDNEGTSALSYDSVVETRRLMREFKDDRGELVPINPDLILVPPELEETASRIVNTMNGGSPQIPDQANFADNFVQRQGIRYLVWDYLTDANDWWMIDSQLAKLYLKWYDRVPLEFTMDPTSDFRLEARFRGYMRYSYGWADWRWVYGHTVT